MTKTLTTFAILAILPAGAVLADDDCRVPTADWQPREAVMTLAEENGWTLRELEIDDGCYEIEARTREGHWVEAKLDPATLAVLKIEYELGAANRTMPNPAPGAIPAPPANGPSVDDTRP